MGKSKVTLGYTRLNLTKRETGYKKVIPAVGSQALISALGRRSQNWHNWTEGDRSDMTGQREEYKAGGHRSSGAVWGFSLRCSLFTETAFSLRIQRDRIAPLSDHWSRWELSSVWLLCFSDASALTPISDSRVLLRTVRIRATMSPIECFWKNLWLCQGVPTIGVF